MNEFLVSLVFWVSIQMGVPPASVEPLKFVFVEAEEMAALVCKQPGPCRIEPASSDPDKIYIVKEYDGQVLDYKKNRQIASFIVHHITHHIQYQRIKKDQEKFVKDFQKYEEQAMEIQLEYLKGADKSLGI